MSEEIVDLHLKGLKLLQNTQYLCFSGDSVRLAEFAAANAPGARCICELGSGNGGLLLALWARLPAACCTGVEIMPANVALAQRSLQLNADVPGFAGKCRFVCSDWRNWADVLPAAAYDLVVSNPPFWPQTTGRLSPVPERRAATHELFGGLGDLLAAAYGLLAVGGVFCLLLPQSRTAEAEELLQSRGFLLIKKQFFEQRVLLLAQK